MRFFLEDTHILEQTLLMLILKKLMRQIRMMDLQNLTLQFINEMSGGELQKLQ